MLAIDDEEIAGDDGTLVSIPDATVEPLMNQDEPVEPVEPLAIEDDEIAGDGADPLAGFPETLMGQEISLIKGRRDERWSYANRLLVRCPRHDACQKTRSVELEKKRFGDKAPLVFLGAWMSRAWQLGPQQHRTWNPKLDEQAAWLKDHPDLE